MTLRELTNKLQNLCHDGYSNCDVLIDLNGNNKDYADIEVRRMTRLSDKHYVSLVAWKKISIKN